MSTKRTKILWKIENFDGESRLNHIIRSSNFGILFNSRNINWELSLQLKPNEECELSISSLSGYFLNPVPDAFANWTVMLQTADRKIMTIIQQEVKFNFKSYFTMRDSFNIIKEYISNDCLTLIIDFHLIEQLNEQKSPISSADANERYFNSDIFSDFAMICSDEIAIPVHRCIIANQSAVFDRMFKSKMLESKTKEIKVDDIDGETMLELLRFVYSNKVQNIDTLASKLMYAAEKYDISALKSICASALANQLSMGNVLETLALADCYNEKQLLEKSMKFVEQNFDELKTKEGWLSVDNVLMLKIVDFMRKNLVFDFFLSDKWIEHDMSDSDLSDSDY